MSHWIVLPIVLPALLAPFFLMVIRHHLDLQRIFSVAGVLALNGITFALLNHAMSGEVSVYELGDWPAPFGIVLVLDRLSALMIVLTSLLALAVVLARGSGSSYRPRQANLVSQDTFCPHCNPKSSIPGRKVWSAVLGAWGAPAVTGGRPGVWDRDGNQWGRQLSVPVTVRRRAPSRSVRWSAPLFSAGCSR